MGMKAAHAMPDTRTDSVCHSLLLNDRDSRRAKVPSDLSEPEL